VTRKRSLLIAVCVGLVSLIRTNLTYGFAAGFLLEGLFRLWRRLAANKLQTRL